MSATTDAPSWTRDDTPPMDTWKRKVMGAIHPWSDIKETATDAGDLIDLLKAQAAQYALKKTTAAANVLLLDQEGAIEVMAANDLRNRHLPEYLSVDVVTERSWVQFPVRYESTDYDVNGRVLTATSIDQRRLADLTKHVPMFVTVGNKDRWSISNMTLSDLAFQTRNHLYTPTFDSIPVQVGVLRSSVFPPEVRLIRSFETTDHVLGRNPAKGSGSYETSLGGLFVNEMADLLRVLIANEAKKLSIPEGLWTEQHYRLRWLNEADIAVSPPMKVDGLYAVSAYLNGTTMWQPEARTSPSVTSDLWPNLSEAVDDLLIQIKLAAQRWGTAPLYAVGNGWMGTASLDPPNPAMG